MDTEDVMYALVDLCYLGDLSFTTIGSKDQQYYATIANPGNGEVFESVNDPSLQTAIIRLRDQAMANLVLTT